MGTLSNASGASGTFLLRQGLFWFGFVCLWVLVWLGFFVCFVFSWFRVGFYFALVKVLSVFLVCFVLFAVF